MNSPIAFANLAHGAFRADPTKILICEHRAAVIHRNKKVDVEHRAEASHRKGGDMRARAAEMNQLLFCWYADTGLHKSRHIENTTNAVRTHTHTHTHIYKALRIIGAMHTLPSQTHRSEMRLPNAGQALLVYLIFHKRPKGTDNVSRVS